MSEPDKQNGRSSDNTSRQRRLGNRMIGERLRQMYDGVVQENVPDEFLKLLEEAEQAEKASKADTQKRSEGDA